MSDSPLESMPTGRAHPFVFVHDALPSILYRDPEGFVDHLRAHEDAHQGLDRLWEDAGKAVAERGMGDALPTTGLAVEKADGDGWRGVVVQLPKTEELGECQMVLMAVPNSPVSGGIWDLFRKKQAPLARIILLKLLKLPGDEKPEFRLCELSPLLGNVTTGYSCAPKAQDFVREVVDCLDLA